MKPETKLNLQGFIIYMLITVSGVLGLLCYVKTGLGREARPVYVTKEVKKPMSIRELQTFLNDQGHPRYRCEIDGKYGRETGQALDNWLCDEQAKKHFPKVEIPKNLEKF